MLWPNRHADRSQAQLIAAVEASNAAAARAALASKKNLNVQDANGYDLLSQAACRESLLLMSALLAAGARPDGLCVESAALWAERADRARRHKRPDADRPPVYANLAIVILNQHRAPCDARPRPGTHGHPQRIASGPAPMT